MWIILLAYKTGNSCIYISKIIDGCSTVLIKREERLRKLFFAFLAIKAVGFTCRSRE